jgi:hypothetical protein
MKSTTRALADLGNEFCSAKNTDRGHGALLALQKALKARLRTLTEICCTGNREMTCVLIERESVVPDGAFSVAKCLDGN